LSLEKVLIAGVSVRAAAASAARAGFAVTAVDAFGDLDQHPGVRSLSLQRNFGVPYSAQALAHVTRDIACDAVVYLSNFENHPSSVAALGRGRMLWGNPPEVLRQVRHPLLVAQALRRRGIAAPDVHVDDSQRRSKQDRSWLIKPLSSGGGHRVSVWQGQRLPRGTYRQELIEGISGSIVFVAANRRVVLLGMSRQLIGEDAFGATGYKYCGSILSGADDPQFPRDEGLAEAASVLATSVAEEFNLTGVNGIDFVASDGWPFLVEVNPRWSASMELIERAYGLSVFQAHLNACVHASLPSFDFRHARQDVNAVGKAVVFARRDVTVGNTSRWLSEAAVEGFGGIADVPHRDERIQAGRPVCTVFATGRDAATCHAELVRRADRVYADLTQWESVATGTIATARQSR
jgi:predicted ATP-grasp superfamily ATP-dependent carboligase